MNSSWKNDEYTKCKEKKEEIAQYAWAIYKRVSNKSIESESITCSVMSDSLQPHGL